MRPFDREPPPRREPDVEALLRDFFRHELPGDLPPLPARAARPVPVVFAAHRRWATGAAAAALFAGAAIWLFRPFPLNRAVEHEVAVEYHSTSPELHDRVIAARAPLLAGPGYYVTAREPSDATSHAKKTTDPRNDFRWRTVAFCEPHSGEQIEIALPQITTELADLTIRINSQGSASPPSDSTDDR